MIKRHTRANPSKNVKAASSEKEGSMSISHVLLLSFLQQVARAGHKFLPDGTKEAGMPPLREHAGKITGQDSRRGEETGS